MITIFYCLFTHWTETTATEIAEEYPYFRETIYFYEIYDQFFLRIYKIVNKDSALCILKIYPIVTGKQKHESKRMLRNCQTRCSNQKPTLHWTRSIDQWPMKQIHMCQLWSNDEHDHQYEYPFSHPKPIREKLAR